MSQNSENQKPSEQPISTFHYRVLSVQSPYSQDNLRPCESGEENRGATIQEQPAESETGKEPDRLDGENNEL